jgi:hypothetical protein
LDVDVTNKSVVVLGKAEPCDGVGAREKPGHDAERVVRNA